MQYINILFIINLKLDYLLIAKSKIKKNKFAKNYLSYLTLPQLFK